MEEDAFRESDPCCSDEEWWYAECDPTTGGLVKTPIAGFASGGVGKGSMPWRLR
jgi:hypothetical protein